MEELQVDIIREEINQVSEVTKKHVKVSEKVGISTVYLGKIRNGDCAKIDTKENIDLLNNILSSYRKEARKQLEDLQSVL